MPMQDFVGLVGPEYEMDVERGHIRNFAKAMSAPLPEFLQGQHPVIPATFLVTGPYTWGYSLERPRGTVFETVDHDLSVPLHAEESFIYHGPLPRAGDKLICRPTIEHVVTKGGSKGGSLTFITVLNELFDKAQVLRVEQRSVTVTTGQAPGEGAWEVDLKPYQPAYHHLDPGDNFPKIFRQQWEDLEEGNGPGRIDTGPLLLRDIVRFQGVVGEDNALHHDHVWAAEFGYPNVFGLGTHQASMLAGYAAHWLEPEAVREFRVRFGKIYWPGDSISYEGVVTRKYTNPDTGNRCADITLSCTRSPGDVLVEAAMKFDFGR